MRIYDHLIRVFQFGPWESAGDLRSGNAGVFGAVPGRTQLFARTDPPEVISNCPPSVLRPANMARTSLTLSNFAVSLWFDPLTEATLSDVTITDGSAFRVVVDCKGFLVEHLNGFVRSEWKFGDPQNGRMRTDLPRWEPGNPKMTRIVRVSCDLSRAEPDGRIFRDHEQPF